MGILSAAHALSPGHTSEFDAEGNAFSVEDQFQGHPQRKGRSSCAWPAVEVEVQTASCACCQRMLEYIGGNIMGTGNQIDYFVAEVRTPK